MFDLHVDCSFHKTVICLNYQSSSVSQFASFVFFVEEKCETARSDDAEGAAFDDAVK